MTIKAKLIANVMVIITIVIGMSLSSFFSMNFLQKKLSYLVERSTPFQLGTVEFQRELQECTTSLVKVNAARNISEYTKFREEAQKSLVNARHAQDALENMSSGSTLFAASDERDLIANELFVAAEARITSDSAARGVNTRVSQQMQVAATHLKELDAHIRTLQVTSADLFVQALKNTDRLSSTLLDQEELRNHVKDLLAVSAAAYNARNNTEFLIAKGKMRSLLGRISKNESRFFVASEIKGLSDGTNAFLQYQAKSAFKNDDAAKKMAAESLDNLTEKITRLHLTLNLEIELGASRLKSETARQGEIFRQSNSANTILLTNSELVALGFTVTSEINRLFTLESPAELDRCAAEISAVFAAIHKGSQRMENSLAGLKAADELKILHGTHTSLEAIRTELFSRGGIVTTLKKKLDAIEQANIAADKLHVIVVAQSAKGNKSISAASDEQAKSISIVKTVVQRSITQIIGIGLVAIVIGILFGFWIYRSVLLPLRVVLDAVARQEALGKEKAALAEAVAGGDLLREVTVSKALVLEPAQLGADEVGQVLQAVVGMSEAQATLDRAFAEMTTALRTSRDEEVRRDFLKSGLNELNKILRDSQEIDALGDSILVFMAKFLDAGVGIIYLYEEKESILLTLSTYAISRSGRLAKGFRLGEGLPGQVAQEQKMICLNTVPADYLPITSALGKADPLSVVIMPIMHNGTIVCVLELGRFRPFGDDDFDFLNQAAEGVAIAIMVNRSHHRVNEMLKQTQAQAEELRFQHEELRRANEVAEERVMSGNRT